MFLSFLSLLFWLSIFCGFNFSILSLFVLFQPLYFCFSFLYSIFIFSFSFLFYFPCLVSHFFPVSFLDLFSLFYFCKYDLYICLLICLSIFVIVQFSFHSHCLWCYLLFSFLLSSLSHFLSSCVFVVFHVTFFNCLDYSLLLLSILFSFHFLFFLFFLFLYCSLEFLFIFFLFFISPACLFCLFYDLFLHFLMCFFKVSLFAVVFSLFSLSVFLSISLILSHFPSNFSLFSDSLLFFRI